MSKAPPKKSPTKAARRPGPGPTDWLEVERLYVQGEYRDAPDGGAPVLQHLSYRELAERFGIRTATVAHRGGAGDWPAKRSAFSREVRDAADRKVIETVSSEVARYTARTMKLGEGLLEIAQARVDRELERLRRIASSAGGQGVSDRRASPSVSGEGSDTPGDAAGADEEEKGMSSGELKNLAEVHAKIVDTRRRELGLDDILLTRARGTEVTTARAPEQFSVEVARAVVAERARRNRTPSGPQGATGEGE